MAIRLDVEVGRVVFNVGVMDSNRGNFVDRLHKGVRAALGRAYLVFYIR